MHSHIPPSMTLKGFCKRAVQYILQDPRVASVDDQTKVIVCVGPQGEWCTKLGGTHPSFHFYYVVADKIRSRSISLCNRHNHWSARIPNDRELRQGGELRQYVKLLFLPHYTNERTARWIVTSRMKNAQAWYSKNNNSCLENFAEDRDAGVLRVSMHPAVIRPDYSPIQSVGVGSIS